MSRSTHHRPNPSSPSRAWVVALAALALLAPAGMTAPVAGATVRPTVAKITDPLRWVVAGDSYSSGEGTRNTAPALGPDGERCARADGSVGRGQTWGLVAQQAADPTGKLALVACSGQTTNYWPTERKEASADGDIPADVVTLSFGGNNLGFAEVLVDCIDIEDGWGLLSNEGCSTSEQELRHRIDWLVGNRSVRPQVGSDRDVTLPALYDDIAKDVRPGGIVVVAGYPQLVEDPGRWSGRYCAGFIREDVPMLRSVVGYFNQQIALQVEAANRRHASAGVTFTFVDTSAVYESPSGRHGLCGKSGSWLNGLVPSHPKSSSYHPTQKGYDALGAKVAQVVEDHRFPPSQAALAQLVGCSAPCQITGTIPFTHPSWGRSTLVTIKPSAGACTDASVAVVSDDRRVRWRRDFRCMESIAPSSIATDTTGRLFVDYNPGRYNGVIVLRPTTSGFDDFGSLPTGDSSEGAYYSSGVVDLEHDGTAELVGGVNDCTPDCARGTTTYSVYRWTGSGLQEEPAPGPPGLCNLVLTTIVLKSPGVSAAFGPQGGYIAIDYVVDAARFLAVGPGDRSLLITTSNVAVISHAKFLALAAPVPPTNIGTVTLHWVPGQSAITCANDTAGD